MSASPEHWVDDLRARIEPWVRAPLEPLVGGLAARGIRPHHVTLAALALGALAALLTAQGWLVLAALALLAGGLLDLMDGMLARRTATASAFGAFLDSTLDRVSEGLVFAAIAYQFALRGEPLLAGATVLALLGSVLVSYARARAEALGIECRVGAVTRAERVLLLAAGLALDLLGPVVVGLLVLGLLTVAQRMAHVHRALRAQT
jgi:CDP-diacylglycerol---glycerol-3-phosphate 3-phosphatidyltransferase